ncbi:hypothetical protein B0H14DRAFT_2919140 [Mycena olivaceomarginata]|nr:hypothetical protein B0H14DRAFT_2919140 [Mycena olivaceomarginata]
MTPAPMIDNEILTVEDANDTVSDANYDLLSLLDIAMDASNPQESAVDDFAELRFLICGESKYAKPDVSILDRTMDDIILLVQEDKRFGAIAAYQVNQSTRTASGLPRLQSLASYWLGRVRRFTRSPLTEELVRCVERGEPHRRWVEGMKPLDNRRIILECYEAFKAFIP